MRHFTSFLLIFFTSISFGQHDHNHETKPSTARERWGDFADGELIKTHPVDYTQTPIAKKVLKNGVPKPAFTYLDNIDIQSMVYNSDGLMVTGFVVQPKEAGNYPCIIYNRGGNRDFGRLLVANAVVQMGQLAAQGYVVIASNYRGNSNSEGREEFGGADVNDVLNLIPALGQLEKADTSRIGMFGVSRGGMMTYLCMKKSSQIDAAVVIGGMSNMNTTIANRPDMESHVFEELIPNYATEKENAIKERSAAYWSDKLDTSCELLILHGSKDERVSVDQAKEMHDLLSESGFPHVFTEFSGDNHGCTKHREEVMQSTFDWFAKYVRDASPFSEEAHH